MILSFCDLYFFMIPSYFVILVFLLSVIRNVVSKSAYHLSELTGRFGPCVNGTRQF